MNVTSATSRRRTVRRAGWPSGSALLLVIVLSGLGGIMPQVGAQAGAALQALSAVGPVVTVVTVAELQRALARDPRRWLGQTVQVRGRLEDVPGQMCPGEPVCFGQPILVDAATVGATAPLPLAWGGPDPLRAALQQLPLLGGLLPQPRKPRWGTVQTYWVRLDAVPAPNCAPVACDRAVILDVAPEDVCYPRHRDHSLFPCAGP